jgi:hypothetical protein
LGQIEEKTDSRGIIARKDVATLLQQGNVALARAKAANLIQEDAFGEVLELILENLGLILERFADIDQGCVLEPISLSIFPHQSRSAASFQAQLL